MNEIDILKELIEKERIAYDLQLRINIWTNQEEKIQFAKELESVSLEVEQLITRLTTIENKSFSAEARHSMIYQLEQYVIEINKVSPYLNLAFLN